VSRQINLFDPSLRRRKDWLTAHNLVLATLISVLLVALGAGITRWTLASRAQNAASVNTQLLAARAAFAAMTASFSVRKADPAIAAEVVQVEQDVRQARKSLDLLRSMTGEPSAPVVAEMMHAFSRAGVDGLWLTGFMVAEGGRQLEIRGRLNDQALLPPYLRRLEGEAVFSGRRFASLDMRGATWKQLGSTEGGASAEAAASGSERWFVEFALRTTDIPKAGADTGGGR